MRICYLCGDLGIPLGGRKGASAHVRGLVQAFAALGHDVVLVSPCVDDDLAIGATVVPVPVPKIVDAIPSNGHPRLVRALRHLWNNVAVEQAVEGVLQDYRPHLLYERYGPFGVAGGIVARRMGIPHVLEVNAPLAWEGAQYRQQALQEAAKALEETAFSLASLIVTVSRELRDELVAAGVEESKIVVVPNGADVDMFGPEGPAYRPGLEGKVVIGFVGSLKAWHGIDILVEAFRILAGDPRFHLLVVGDGPMAKTLHSLREELPGRVTVAGAVSHAEVPGFIRGMDVAVAPYPQLAPFYFSPLKVLEYMATGRAVVASRIGQLADLIRDGETGLMVSPGDADALAVAVRRLADDDALRHTIGAAAAAEVRSAHTWGHRASQILEAAGKASIISDSLQLERVSG